MANPQSTLSPRRLAPVLPLVRDSAAAGGLDRNRALEACRGIAAAMVVLYHLAAYTDWPARFAPRLLLSNGDAGVTLFFVLSGFLLWRPFASGIDARTRTWNSVAFLRNRALRILPAYWVALTVVAVVSGGVGIAHYLLAMNFDRSALFSGISPAWSLALEAMFYLCLPMLGAAGVALSRRVRSVNLVQYGLIATWMGVSLAYKAIAFATGHGPSDAFVHFSFPAKAHLFGFGMIMAVWHARSSERGPISRERGWLAPAAGALIVAAAVATRYDSQSSQLWFDTITALGFSLLILPLAFRGVDRPGPLHRIMLWSPLVWLGTISYSLYLWHHPVLGWMNDIGMLRPSMSALPLNIVFALTVSTLIAWLSYGFVEYPFLKRRVPWSTRTERTRKAA